MNSEQTKVVMDEVIKVVERLASDFDERLSAFEQVAGVQVARLTDDDEDRTDFQHNQLAALGGAGLAQWDGKTKTWRVVVNGVEAVAIEGDELVVERSDGSVDRTPITRKAA